MVAAARPLELEVEEDCDPLVAAAVAEEVLAELEEEPLPLPLPPPEVPTALAFLEPQVTDKQACWAVKSISLFSMQLAFHCVQTKKGRVCW